MNKIKSAVSHYWKSAVITVGGAWALYKYLKKPAIQPKAEGI